MDKNALLLASCLLLAVLVIGGVMAADVVNIESLDVSTPPPQGGGGAASTSAPAAPQAAGTPDAAASSGSAWLTWTNPTSQLPAGMASGSTHLSYGMSSILWPHVADYAENYGYLSSLTPLRSDQWALHLCEDRHLRASNGMSLAVSLTGSSRGAWLIAERTFIDTCLGVAGCTNNSYFIYRINGLVDGRDFVEASHPGQTGERYHPLVFNILFRQKSAASLPTDANTRGLNLDVGKEFVYFEESFKLPPEQGSNITMVDFTGPKMGVKNSTNYYDEICLMLTVAGDVYNAGSSGAWNALSMKFALPDLESYSWGGTQYWLLCSPVPASGGYLRYDLENYLQHDPGDVPDGMDDIYQDDYSNYGLPQSNGGF